MKNRLFAVALLAGALVLPAQSFAGKDKNKDQAWIHVEVIEQNGDGSKVSVNLPLSMADVALQMAESKDHTLSRGRISLEDHDVSVQDLRKLWQDLRAAGDAEFVTIEDDDDTVRIYRKGDRVHVDVRDNGDEDDAETVKIEMPVSVVDALLGGEDDALDLQAALAELKTMGPGEIVRVEDGGDHVRIWID